MLNHILSDEDNNNSPFDCIVSDLNLDSGVSINTTDDNGEFERHKLCLLQQLYCAEQQWKQLQKPYATRTKQMNHQMQFQYTLQQAHLQLERLIASMTPVTTFTRVYQQQDIIDSLRLRLYNISSHNNNNTTVVVSSVNTLVRYKNLIITLFCIFTWTLIYTILQCLQ